MVRIGCPSLYSMTSFADIAYPADILPPVDQSNNWYLNPTTGNDSNDGTTPSTAWKSAAKVTAESQYSGMLDSNAAGPGGGDVLTIDTSAGPLVIGASTLTFATQGLKVQPATGQTYIKCQAEQILANASFTFPRVKQDLPNLGYPSEHRHLGKRQMDVARQVGLLRRSRIRDQSADQRDD